MKFKPRIFLIFFYLTHYIYMRQIYKLHKRNFKLLKKNFNKIVIDLDNTISFKSNNESYADAKPDMEMIETIIKWHNLGFQICIYTSRNMNSYEGQIGKINARTLPIIIDWLCKYKVPYDEIIVGKPWCGHNGFYVDDKAVRPDEFKKLSKNQIYQLIGKQIACKFVNVVEVCVTESKSRDGKYPANFSTFGK